MSKIHPTAIVEDGATLGADVEIGPFCTVGAKVTLGDGVRLISHVALAGRTTLGAKCEVYPFASLGYAPQSLAYKDEDTSLVIGANVIIRESVTMNPGTAQGRATTTVGNDCMFMANSHVAHDCVVGNNVVFANCATIGGHVELGDFVWIGGLAAVHQWTRVGRNAFIGGVSPLVGDLIPFGSVMGNRAHLAGLNLVGLKRRGFSRETIHDLRSAYRLLFAEEGTFQERLEDTAETYSGRPEVMEIVDFIRAGGNRPLCLPHRED